MSFTGAQFKFAVKGATWTAKAGTNGCLVLTGTLREPYTGKDMRFVRGQGTSSAVQIDHVVALSDAWQKGAQKLDAGTRARFANDPLNLLAVNGPTNQSKSDGDAATWLVTEAHARLQERVEAARGGTEARPLIPDLVIDRKGLGGKVLDFRAAIATGMRLK